MLTVLEAADRLGVAKRRVHELARLEGLPLVRLSEQQFRVDEAALDGWLASRAVGKADEGEGAAPRPDVPARPAPGTDEAAAREREQAAARVQARAQARWEGMPDPMPSTQLPAGWSVGPGGVLLVNGRPAQF